MLGKGFFGPTITKVLNIFGFRVCVPQTTLTSSYSSCTLKYSPNTAKYFPQILHKFKFLLSTMPDNVKGTIFRENRMGDHKLAYNEKITNFWLSST
jgi:hypothetical protein